MLGDVHARQHFDAGDDSRGERQQQMCDLVKRAVDTEPHPETVLHRLQMHVARAVRRGARDDAIDQRGGRPLGLLVVQIQLGTRHVDHDRLSGIVLFVGTPESVAVVLVERRLDLRFHRDHHLHFAAGGEAEVVERGQVLRARDGDDQRRADLQQWKRGVLTRDFFWQRLHGLRVDGVRVDAGRWHAELTAQGFEDRFRCREAHLDQHATEASPRSLLAVHRLGELLLRDELALKQDRTQRRRAGSLGRRCWTRRLCRGRRIGVASHRALVGCHATHMHRRGRWSARGVGRTNGQRWSGHGSCLPAATVRLSPVNEQGSRQTEEFMSMAP